jgi:hypothetical protein
MRLIIITLSLLFALNALADGSLNTQYPRIMGCQTLDAYLYVEIFHDQAGFMGAPKNPLGYLVVWSTAMGKDTQKRVVLDVPMKHVPDSSGGCTLDVTWSTKAGSGATATSTFNLQVPACNLLDHAPKGKITQTDVYTSGKTVVTTANLMCQLQ